jgi:hypothetical protein
MKPRLVLVALVALVCAAVVAVVGTAGATSDASGRHGSYEVWLIDQEDKYQAGAGTLHIFDGEELAEDASTAVPESIDLAGELASLCQERTGSPPLRPHMLVFNGGDDRGRWASRYAVIAYVASGRRPTSAT